MNSNLSAFGLLPLALLCSACSAGKASKISQGGCDVALRYARDFKTTSGIPIAIKHSPDADDMSISVPKNIESFLREHPEFKNDPILPLERKLSALRDVSVVGSCPELEGWYRDNSTILDDSFYDKVAKEMPSLDRPDRKALKNAMLEISAPAISDDGNTAYFYVAEATRTAGGRFSITYKKNSEGNWQLNSKNSIGGIP
jgi:hypothetical protein